MIFHSLEVSFFDWFAIDLYRVPSTLWLGWYVALQAMNDIPIYEMWRIECPCADCSALEKCRRVVADGPFAIGAGDMYRFPWILDILEQETYALQSGLNHIRLTSVRIAFMIRYPPGRGVGSLPRRYRSPSGFLHWVQAPLCRKSSQSDDSLNSKTLKVTEA